MNIYFISVIFLISSIISIAQNQTNWIGFENLNSARSFHSAVLLSNGNILVSGGQDEKGNVLSTCEIYDFKNKNWRNTSSMNFPRYRLVLVHLLDNRVLAIGGQGIRSCEIFDPVTETWSVTDSLHVKRYTYDINAILLDDGRVLVAGGFDIKADIDNRYLNICEIFDPVTNKWTLTDTLKSKRAGHTMTKLKNGKILIAGGYNNEFEIKKCELFDPHTNQWSFADSLNFAKSAHTAILLSDGKLLIAGGKEGGDTTDPWSSSCELYDPDRNEWLVVGSLSVSRTYANAFLISDNLIMFAGGAHNAHLWELYDANKFDSVHLDFFPVDKFDQEILITKDSSLISIAGTEVDMNGGIPLLFASNKCEIYKLGITSIDNENPIPQDFILNQNYPNPFNPETIITYQLIESRHITLNVYDILGKRITLVNEEQGAGIHKIQFDAGKYNLSSGIYFYRLKASDFILTKKMIMLQ